MRGIPLPLPAAKSIVMIRQTVNAMLSRKIDSMANVIRIIFFFPIHLLLGLIIRLRHFLYDGGWLGSTSFKVPVICIGNLELGGSGKTPMTDFLISKFSGEKKIAFLSRGYGRKSKGFRWLDQCTGPLEAGDEPWQLYQKWGQKLCFAVCEDRVEGIRRILNERPETEIILLDDAYQHRSLQPGFSILLSPFRKPFFQNYLFPAGTLRDIPSAASRADLLVFTKADSACQETWEVVRKAADSAGFQDKQVFVSEVCYGQAQNLPGDVISAGSRVSCIAGLADNKPFFQYCAGQFQVAEQLSMPDHYSYPPDFFRDKGIAVDGFILCPEKDFAKIRAVFPFPDKVFYLPIQIRIFPEDSFLDSLEKYLSV